MRQRIIILRGIVEGIGMRPALSRFSVEHGLRGYVCNLSGFVKLLWQGDASRIEQAFAELGSAFPDGSRVDFPTVFTDSEADCIYSDFSIIKRRWNFLRTGKPPDSARPCALCEVPCRNPFLCRSPFRLCVQQLC
ncbi:MAG: acylphosphatase [Victivallales bacterium]